MERAIEYDKLAYICFVDVTNAFDRGRLEDVINILKEKELDKSHLEIMRKLNTNNGRWCENYYFQKHTHVYRMLI